MPCMPSDHSLALLLLWIYYTAQIFLFGAEFTHAYARRFGSHAGAGDPSDRPSGEEHTRADWQPARSSKGLK